MLVASRSMRPLRTKAGPEVTASRVHCRLRCGRQDRGLRRRGGRATGEAAWATSNRCARSRSEEHTSELQSRGHLVCRLLLEKKNKKERRMGFREGGDGYAVLHQADCVTRA